jgi:hypothetical protein
MLSVCQVHLFHPSNSNPHKDGFVNSVMELLQYIGAPDVNMIANLHYLSLNNVNSFKGLAKDFISIKWRVSISIRMDNSAFLSCINRISVLKKRIRQFMLTVLTVISGS